ncbi:hypothetical protein COOONC_18951 [Cooperia oncophora]
MQVKAGYLVVIGKKYELRCATGFANLLRPSGYALACADDTPSLQLVPFCLAFKVGYETEVWCQRYELFCNEKERRDKANELIASMDGAVKVHYR